MLLKLNVSRGHLSRRSENELLALVERIAALKRQRAIRVANHDGGAPVPEAVAPAPSPTVTAGALAELPDSMIDVMVSRDLRELTRLQEQWVARHARGSPIDAPLALYDADELLRRLRGTLERLRPTVTERTRRQNLEAVLGVDNRPLALALDAPAFK